MGALEILIMTVQNRLTPPWYPGGTCFTLARTALRTAMLCCYLLPLPRPQRRCPIVVTKFVVTNVSVLHTTTPVHFYYNIHSLTPPLYLTVTNVSVFHTTTPVPFYYDVHSLTPPLYFSVTQVSVSYTTTPVSFYYDIISRHQYSLSVCLSLSTHTHTHTHTHIYISVAGGDSIAIGIQSPSPPTSIPPSPRP